MVTKTFRSETMLKTLQMVQQELGADAIVVSTREIPTGPSWNPWKQSAIEIVAATPDELPEKQNQERTVKKPASKPPVLRPSANASGVEFVEESPTIEWVDDVVEVSPQAQHVRSNANVWQPTQAERESEPLPDQQIGRPVRRKPEPHQEPVPPVRKSPAKTAIIDHELPAGLKKIHQQLTNQAVDPVLVEGLMNVAIEALSPTILTNYESCKKYITQLLGAELRVQQGLGVYVSSNLVCLIGSSGGGKTSTIAKLALFYSKNLKKTVTWVCADTVRIGAIAEARAYTDALGLNLKLVYSPSDIKKILADAQETDLFLLDTPGFNPCSESQMVELGALLAEIPKRCTYLVAPATTKETDLFQLSASLGVFNLDGIIITKLDETHLFGSVYNFVRKNQVPLGFFTTGREAARHLEIVDPARLVSALFGKEWNK